MNTWSKRGTCAFAIAAQSSSAKAQAILLGISFGVGIFSWTAFGVLRSQLFAWLEKFRRTVQINFLRAAGFFVQPGSLQRALGAMRDVFADGLRGMFLEILSQAGQRPTLFEAVILHFFVGFFFGFSLVIHF